jgi:hypothetical protein
LNTHNLASEIGDWTLNARLETATLPKFRCPAQYFKAAIEDESNMIFMQRDGIVKREGQMSYQDSGSMLSAHGGLQALDS